MSIKDYLQSMAFTCDLLISIRPTGIFELRVARDKRASQPLLALEVATDVPRSDYIVLEAKIFRHQLVLARVHSDDGRLVGGLVGALQRKHGMEIGIAGSGNMAYRLVPALQHVGLRVGQIWNRSQKSDLAAKYQLKMCTQPEDMEPICCLFAYQMMQLLK